MRWCSLRVHEVYAYGVIAAGTLYRIRGSFPAAEGYAEIESTDFMTGGEAANSSIVLARLGADVKLDGNRIGDDASGSRTKALLTEYGIDTSRLTPIPGHKSVEEAVFAAEATRTIFGTYIRLQETEAWNIPDETDITQAKVVCLDPFFKDASLRAGKVGSRAGIPVVTVDCLFDDALLDYVSAVVVSESFIRENYADRSHEDLFEDYQRAVDGLVVFTFGHEAIWYARSGEAVRQSEPFSVAVVDTAGAGDAFRAGVVFGILKNWDDEQIIRFSAALAAIVCTRSPGVVNSPSYDEVVDFIAEQPS